MNLKELIKEVELINSVNKTEYSIGKLKGIRKTVEAVDSVVVRWTREYDSETYDYWQHLKKLLEVN